MSEGDFGDEYREVEQVVSEELVGEQRVKRRNGRKAERQKGGMAERQKGGTVEGRNGRRAERSSGVPAARRLPTYNFCNINACVAPAVGSQSLPTTSDFLKNQM